MRTRRERRRLSRGLWLQVHIKHAGQGKMLLNTHRLPGANERALGLAGRQAQESSPADHN